MKSALIRLLEVPHPPNELPPTVLISHDTQPIEKERRVWGWSGYFGIWATVGFSMSNFQLGAAMLGLGLNWWQATVVTLFGHILGAVVVVIMGFPGLEYRISFPISMRVAWGFSGSIFVVLTRTVTTVIGTGLQAWLGGLVTYVCLRALWPSIDGIPNGLPAATGTNTPQFIGFIVFCVIQFALFLLTPQHVRYLLIVGSCTGFMVQIVLLIWACSTRGELGFGSVLSNGIKLSGSELGWTVIYCLSLTASSITSGILSVCDYTRFAKTVQSGTYSQLAGAFPSWLCNVFGVLTIAATQNRYGAQLWSAPSLLIAMQDADGSSGTRAAVFFAGLCMLISQLGFNVAGNTFSGGSDLAALLPRWINIRRGQFITAFLAIVINPWYLQSNATAFTSAISSFQVFLQPCLGIMIAQYFVLQKRRLRVPDLYMVGPRSIYSYSFGLNWRAVLAWLSGAVPHIPGFLHNVNPTISISDGGMELYYMDAFTGFLIPFVVTILLDILTPVPEQKAFVQSVTVPEAITLMEEFLESRTTTEAETVETNHVEVKRDKKSEHLDAN